MGEAMLRGLPDVPQLPSMRLRKWPVSAKASGATCWALARTSCQANPGLMRRVMGLGSMALAAVGVVAIGEFSCRRRATRDKVVTRIRASLRNKIERGRVGRRMIGR